MMVCFIFPIAAFSRGSRQEYTATEPSFTMRRKMEHLREEMEQIGLLRQVRFHCLYPFVDYVTSKHPTQTHALSDFEILLCESLITLSSVYAVEHTVLGRSPRPVLRYFSSREQLLHFGNSYISAAVLLVVPRSVKFKI